MKQPLTRLCLALLSGLLLGISFPDRSLSLCAWVALVPLFFALAGSSRGGAFLLSWAAGCCFFGIIFQWSLLFGAFTWLALCLMYGFSVGICGALVAPFLNSDRGAVRIIYPALIWVCYEYVRSFGPLGLNWGSIAYSQYTCLPLVQVVGITGMYGVTFMIVLFNGAVREMLMASSSAWKAGKGIGAAVGGLDRATAVSIVIALLLPCAASCGGYGRIAWDRSREKQYPRVKISTVQPSRDMCLKWNPSMQRMSLATLEELTGRGLSEGAALFVWPESAVPAYFPNDARVTARLCSLASARGIYLLTGAPYLGRDGQVYNQAFLISPGEGIVESYAKRRLVPFSENLPFNRYLRKFSPFNRFSDVRPGAAWKTFTTPMARFGVLICFESDFPYIARLNTRRGAQFLAVLTNDAWFERSPAAAHHLSWSVFRAVENHANIVQSANTGISAFIDYNGRIRSSTGIFTRAVLTGEITLQPAGTFYTFAGDYFPLLCLLAAAIPWIAARAGRSRGKTGRENIAGDGMVTAS